MDPATLRRALAKKTPYKTRKRSEFSGTSKAVGHPQRQQPIGSWTLEAIRAARDDQMRGKFKQPVRLAEATRTDDAVFVARLNRLAPHSAIASELRPASDSSRATTVAARAAKGVFLSRTTLEGAIGTLADHGIAILHIRKEYDPEGTRVDFHVDEWPLEFVEWNRTLERLETQTKAGLITPIVHGDGEWVVIKKFAVLPWTQTACLLPIALLWAGHAYGLADWAQATRSHGQAKMAAKLGEGVALEERGEDGAIALSPEAAATLQTLQDMVSGDAGAGVFPNNTEVDFLANGSTAWQVFNEFVQNREKGAARIYLGTDATMGSQGGAPGVDISVLFGVASTIVQTDLEAVMQAVNSGVYVPWTAVNEGDSRYAPTLVYLIPDPDSARKRDESAANETALATAVKAYRDAGVVVDQPLLDRLAKQFNVSPAPKVGDAPTPAQPGRGQLRALAGGKIDESKIRRAEDGRFGDKPGAGGSESDGPKGRDGAESGGGDGDGDEKNPEAKGSTRAEKAEARLADAKATHEEAVKVRDAEVARRQRGLDALDQRAKNRLAAADEADALADEAKAEIKRVDAEYRQVQKEMRDAGVDPAAESDDHPLIQKSAELSEQDERLREMHANLRAEAKANRRPDKRLAKARAALEAGDAKTFARVGSDAGHPSRDAVADWRARQGYRAKGNTGEPGEDHYDAVRERYLARDPMPRTDVGFEDDNMPDPRHAERKAARAARAVAVHEREVKRARGKVDADGDGRTGNAEERDDEKA